ncbi:hypothetical protein OM076_21345 [Solirubrobacter ginsenosidimutans]|uniref:DUF6603 domain-containing protein n=1 Tax=Solirubrobacter ginsenosidimutans TaxID=490573 RepID=A0A9X3N0X4_9ACTN|nr:DUF6603 domain-containing protein [Solirubrobacter ginsenosidimutans]MDA0162833.1 hypothetical protein [Solirubrobacter ginsenosidimutans]
MASDTHSSAIGLDALAIRATHRSGQWCFSGESDVGQDLDLGEVVQRLAELIHVELPDLPAVTVDRVAFEVCGAKATFEALVGLALRPLGDLSRLPLVGDHLQDAIRLDTVGIKVVRESGKDRAYLGARVGIAGEPAPTDVRVPLTPDPETGTVDAEPQRHAVQRRFGPVEVEDLIYDFHDGGLRVRFTARLGHAGVEIEVIGMGVTVRLDDPLHPEFHLDGLSMSYEAPPVRVSGALLRRPDTPAGEWQFDGALSVRAGAYELSARGSYADRHPPSLFAFLQVMAPMGGPPYFFIDGIAGGFGINRTLTIPPIEEIEDFPLIRGTAPTTNVFAENTSVADAMAILGEAIQPADQQHWMAAGVAVSSFGVLHSKVLLTVAFGHRVEIGLLGMATLRLPPGLESAVVSASLALRTTITPGSGELAILGRLTSDSYVLAPACRLTGGFALCFWFGGSGHRGDFVITLGGYHPAFEAPAHYPVVPRLGLTWDAGPLQIKGGQYFALTPGAAMLGGQLDATYKSGAVSARFKAHVDFLSRWAPLRYEATVGVDFAVDAVLHEGFATSTLSVHVSAELRMWGPEFSGEAELDLGVIRITIPFGHDPDAAPKSLSWPEVKHQLLGGEEGAVRVAVRSGVLADLRDPATGKAGETGVHFIVDPERLVVATETVIAATRVTVDGAEQQVGPQRIGIAPMGLGSVTSTHAITIEPAARLHSSLVTGTVPKALWGDGKPTLGADGTIAGAVTGVEMCPAPAQPRPAAQFAREAPPEVREWSWPSLPASAAADEPPGPVDFAALGLTASPILATVPAA